MDDIVAKERSAINVTTERLEQVLPTSVWEAGAATCFSLTDLGELLCSSRRIPSGDLPRVFEW